MFREANVRTYLSTSAVKLHLAERVGRYLTTSVAESVCVCAARGGFLAFVTVKFKICEGEGRNGRSLKYLNRGSENLQKAKEGGKERMRSKIIPNVKYKTFNAAHYYDRIELSYVLASLRTSLPNVSKGCLPHETMRNDKNKEKLGDGSHMTTVIQRSLDYKYEVSRYHPQTVCPRPPGGAGSRLTMGMPPGATLCPPAPCPCTPGEGNPPSMPGAKSPCTTACGNKR